MEQPGKIKVMTRSSISIFKNFFNVRSLKGSKKLHVEKSITRHIPYSHHLDKYTVESFDMSMSQVLEFEGINAETEDYEYLNNLKIQRSQAFSSLANQGIKIYHYILKRDEQIDVPYSTSNPMGQKISQAWYSDLQDNALKTVKVYLVICKTIVMADRFNKSELNRQSALEELTTAVKTLEETFAGYKPKKLGIIKKNGVLISEPLSFFSYFANYTESNIPLVFSIANQSLSFTRPIFHTESIEMISPDEHFYLAPLVIKKYPEESFFHLTDALLRSSYEFSLMQFNNIKSRDWANRQIQSEINKSSSASKDANMLRELLLEQKDLISSGLLAYAEHQMIIMCKGKTQFELQKAVNAIKGMLQNFDMIASREIRIGLDAAFFAMFPTNFSYLVRKYPITTNNMGALTTLHNFPQGKRKHHWGLPVTTLRSTGNTPYEFGWHIADVGFAIIVGGTGGGKTTLLNFLLAQSLKYNPQIIMLDYLQGSQIFIESIGGDYTTFGTEMNEAGKREFSGMSPFSCEDTAKNRFMLFELVRLCVTRNIKTFTATDENKLDTAINEFFDLPEGRRNIRTFAQYLDSLHDEDLGTRFKSWHTNGRNAWLFDDYGQKKKIVNFTNNYIGFDQTTILDDETCKVPAYYYLLDQASRKIDGKTPTIFVVEEGWSISDEEIIAKKIDTIIRTGRRAEVNLIFASQRAKDFDTKIGKSIVDAATQNIFFPNARSNGEDYMRCFKLTHSEAEWIKTTAEHSRHFLLKATNQTIPIDFLLSRKTFKYINILSTRIKGIKIWRDILNKNKQKYADKDKILTASIDEFINIDFED